MHPIVCEAYWNKTVHWNKKLFLYVSREVYDNSICPRKNKYMLKKNYLNDKQFYSNFILIVSDLHKMCYQGQERQGKIEEMWKVAKD